MGKEKRQRKGIVPWEALKEVAGGGGSRREGNGWERRIYKIISKGDKRGRKRQPPRQHLFPKF